MENGATEELLLNNNIGNEGSAECGKLSQSAPNTSFIYKTVPDWTTGGGVAKSTLPDDSDNANEGEPKACPSLMTVKEGDLTPKDGNESLLQDFKELKCSQQVKRISLDPSETRTHRVDVLWRVSNPLPEEEDKTLSHCTLQDGSVYTTPSKIISQYNYKLIPDLISGDKSHLPPATAGTRTEELLTSQTNLDPNQNEMGVIDEQKKSDDRIHIPDAHGDNRIPQQKKNRREPFNWPWHSGDYALNVRFLDPQFRRAFSSKILFLKALQWSFVAVWVYCSKHIGYLEAEDDLMWSVYVASFVFFMTYVIVRSTNFLDTHPSSYVVLAVYTFCIAHIAASVYIVYTAPFVPMILITLALTYLFCASFFYCIKINYDSNLIFYPALIFTLMSSIVAFWFTFIFRSDFERIGYFLAAVWFPCVMFAFVLTAAEISEIQALIEGARLPLLQTSDWVLATIFLI